MADEERKSKRLQVANMRPEDSGRGIARLRCRFLCAAHSLSPVAL